MTNQRKHAKIKIMAFADFKEDFYMKKLLTVLLSVALLATCVGVFAGCGGKEAEIALVTDVGNIDDKSFNEGAWNGVKEYADKHNVTYAYYRPATDTNESRISTIKTAINKGAKIVVCPGYLFETAIYEVQDSYKDVAFLLLDGQPNDGNQNDTKYKTGDNVHNILYKEEQAGYLAGYASVMDGYTNLGFMGGIAVPAVVRYGYGYVQGAEAAAKELGLDDNAITMKYKYMGSFEPSDNIKTEATSWYSGSDVIFACGGKIYESVLSAANDANKKMIGVDVNQVNQSDKGKDVIISSAMKELSQSVVLSLEAFYKNSKVWPADYSGKTATLGAVEDCVGLPTDTASWGFKEFTTQQYNEVYAQIKAGTLVIKNDITASAIMTFQKVKLEEGSIIPVK